MSPAPQPRRRVPLALVLVGVVAVVLLGAVAFGTLRKSNGASSSGLVQVQPVTVNGNPLPEFPGNGSADPAVGLAAPVLEGRSFDGSKVTIGGKTGQPTLVMFMAHWCPHCQREVPLVVQWRADGTIIRGMEEGLPPVVTGPDAPTLTSPDDPWAWHDMPGDLPAHGMRRRRRIDVVPGPAGEPVVVDAMFRDSHVDDQGAETIVHEYTMLVHVDPRDWHVLTAHATPQVLPWFECPEAAASATRLAGDPLDGLRARVRAEFVGTTTCTHLNDALRALEDVPALVRHL